LIFHFFVPRGSGAKIRPKNPQKRAFGSGPNFFPGVLELDQNWTFSQKKGAKSAKTHFFDHFGVENRTFWTFPNPTRFQNAHFFVIFDDF
jgi:hypothetical protein